MQTLVPPKIISAEIHKERVCPLCLSTGLSSNVILAYLSNTNKTRFNKGLERDLPLLQDRVRRRQNKTHSKPEVEPGSAGSERHTAPFGPVHRSGR